MCVCVCVCGGGGGRGGGGVPFLKYKKFSQADFFLLSELELKAAGFHFQKHKTFFNPGIRQFHF